MPLSSVNMPTPSVPLLSQETRIPLICAKLLDMMPPYPILKFGSHHKVLLHEDYPQPSNITASALFHDLGTGGTQPNQFHTTGSIDSQAPNARDEHERSGICRMSAATDQATERKLRDAEQGRIERPNSTRTERRINSLRKTGGRLYGQRYYTKTEVDMLIDIVEQIEPISHNKWAEVYFKISVSATRAGNLVCDFYIVK